MIQTHICIQTRGLSLKNHWQDDLERLYNVADTAGTGIGTMGHSTSPRITRVAITSRANKPLFGYKHSQQDQERGTSLFTRSPQAG